MVSKRDINNISRGCIAGLASFLFVGLGFMMTHQYKKFFAYLLLSIILYFANLGALLFFVTCVITNNNSTASQMLVWLSGGLLCVFFLLAILVWVMSIINASLDAYNANKLVDELTTVD